MTLSTLLVYIVVLLILLIFILFPEARKLLKGFIRLFIKDMASTPEGAEAIYSEKINEAQESYNKADDAYKKAAGKLSNARKNLNILKIKIKECEEKCEKLVQKGDLESAHLKAEEREEILADIERCTTLIKAYEDAELTAHEAYDLCQNRLKNLQKEKREIVENMKVKAQLKDIYDDTDDLKAATTTDKLLESVREKNRSLDEIVEGSKVVHNNKASTKIRRADEKAKKLQSNDYLESLKKKYNK